MSKPFTPDDLNHQLTEDLLWRLREISDLKDAASRADERARKVLLRSLVTICYAHWEGHVKLSAYKFLQHIALRRIEFHLLASNFVQAYFLPRLTSTGMHGSTEAKMSLVKDIMSCGHYRFTRVNDEIVSTRANLDFDVLAEICAVCGMDIGKFSSESAFINLILLKRRNSIAHGEDTLIGIEEVEDMPQRTIALMRSFSTELANTAILRTYRAVH